MKAIFVIVIYNLHIHLAVILKDYFLVLKLCIWINLLSSIFLPFWHLLSYFLSCFYLYISKPLAELVFSLHNVCTIGHLFSFSSVRILWFFLVVMLVTFSPLYVKKFQYKTRIHVNAMYVNIHCTHRSFGSPFIILKNKVMKIKMLIFQT